MTYARFIT